MQNPSAPAIVLASSSQYRRDLLERFLEQFETVSPNVDEHNDLGLESRRSCSSPGTKKGRGRGRQRARRTHHRVRPTGRPEQHGSGKTRKSRGGGRTAARRIRSCCYVPDGCLHTRSDRTRTLTSTPTRQPSVSGSSIDDSPIPTCATINPMTARAVSKSRVPASCCSSRLRPMTRPR